jgi:hypothetical protein
MGFFDRWRKSQPGAAPPRDSEPASTGPPKCEGNPGRAVSGNVAFSNDERSWTEHFDVVAAAADVLGERGHQLIRHETWLELRPSGFVLQPLLVELRPVDGGGVQTLTTVDVRHPELIPGGLFEFQHSTGDDTAASIRRGFEGWEEIDLPVLLDALRVEPEKCTLLVISLPAKDGRPARTRRAVLGGVAWFAAQQPPTEAAEHPATGEEDGHSFCGCCFLTRSHEAFRDLMEGDDCVGLRFYAMRDDDGAPGADCRVNGLDFEAGTQALRRDVEKWPGSGFEFRKQYVLLHTVGIERLVR